MAINKVVYGGKTLLDLTQDTVSSSNLLQGYTAHGKNGQKINGALTFVAVHSGSTNPDASLGSNGDIYLQYSDTNYTLTSFTHDELSAYSYSNVEENEPLE